MEESQPTQLSPLPNAEITLNAHAETLASTLATDYENSLIELAKMLATRQRADQVQRVHVEQAHTTLAQIHYTSWSREFLLIVGGAFFGASIQGFIEALADNKKPLVITFVILGFLGMVMVFQALRQR